ncbi:hypothetical protein AVEN_212193-1 [Araneus ventricosus]|uniref:Uncharacterized protein n=1 Tax=Araneus ventricosus TaxID=182803 RepID=A0A4Y2N5Y9_ARAVE|nr:hypothetical protein AVEN_167719-1 [Araneus ventricosus]GBO27725.1 hypothetical protein AVEN_212193-1 [Araneus ventricosus]
MRVIKFGRQIVSECNSGDVVFLPRIKLATSDVNLPFVLNRRQFSLIRESPHSSQRQETISRVCYKKSPSSAGKKNGTMEKQAGAFITFCQKSRQLLLHGKGQK